MLPQIPSYVVESELGRGGMGVVYKCRHQPSDRLVAVKLMLQGRSATFGNLARFRVEAEALACLDHRNIARVLDIGVIDGCPYFATEFASNGTIGDYSTRHNKEIDWCVDAIRQVAQGVHHANTRSMIHRDIKPANILVMENETLKVSDFGLVKFRAPVRYLATASRAPDLAQSFMNFDLLLADYGADGQRHDAAGELDPHELVDALGRECLQRTGLSEAALDLGSIEQFLETVVEAREQGAPPPFPPLDGLTGSGAILGSPQFMAPEQLLGDPAALGPHTDVYGLGATLYWLLTGQSVASGRDYYELFRSIRTEFPKPVLELNARVSESLESVVWKAIQKDPPRRYENCKVLAEELLCCLEGTRPAAQKSREQRREETPRNTSADAKYKGLFLRMFPPKKG
jgi:eukaryotic-like serine/threonine-protein kinase